uniref:ABC transporter n=1 Tax=Thermosporothrix sp. COM3 TaxID=2490863 RepID=A0A455SSL4_9CHLR|nr:ABC transporter [Thermosporothrix sp. COM3]
MNIRAVLAIARKDLLDSVVNKSSALTLVLPLVIAAFFVLAANLIGTRNVAVLLYQKHSDARIEQLFGEIFPGVKVTQALSATEVSQRVEDESGPYTIGIVIPDDLEQQLQKGKEPHVQLYLRGIESEKSTQAEIQAVLRRYIAELRHDQPIHIELMVKPSSTFLSERPWDILKKTFAVAGCLVANQYSLSIAAAIFVEEKEKKILRLLLLAPSSFATVIQARALVAFLYQMAASLMVLALLTGFSGLVPMQLLFIVLFTLFSLSLGFICVCVCHTGSALGGVAGILWLLTFFPAFLGMFLGIGWFPEGFLMNLLKLFPTYYFADGLYLAFINVHMVSAIWADLLVFGIWTVASMMVAYWLLRRQERAAMAI